ncbi:MAG: hypothetical protein M0011_01535 [Elusimicrobia bacterium]|nr:hypothetical protein [Elusimicrobiota bacterium]
MTAAVCLLLLLPLRAGAAAPDDGRADAAAAAGLRLEGPALVQIEGFTGPDGDVPCRPRSFSNTWHYKFRSGGEWLTVDACGSDVINVSRDLSGGGPSEKLPYRLAAPSKVLKKLAADGVFTAEADPYGRSVLMRAAVQPAKDGRPAGCYWHVSQGKAEALADCAGERTWKITAAPPKARAAGAASGDAVKGRDTAGRYSAKAVEAIRKQVPDARLMFVEALVDRTGSAKCMAPEDGWSFVFASRSMASQQAFGGCAGKTASQYVTFDGKGTSEMARLEPVSLPFKDSDYALSKLPKDVLKGYSTISMKLKNFKPAYAPVTGHSQVWMIDCGSLRYLVDARTGSYLGTAGK